MAVATFRSAASARVRLRRRRRPRCTRRRGRRRGLPPTRREPSGRRSRCSFRSRPSPRAFASPSAGTTASTPGPRSSSPARSCCRRRWSFGLVLALHAAGVVSSRSASLVHPGLQPLELHAQRSRCLGRRRCRRSRRRRHVCAGRTARRRGLRRRQPHAARDHAAARPRPHVPRERALLARPASGSSSCSPCSAWPSGRLHRVQSLAPAGPDRPARARPPLALDRRAPARERGAVPDDVRVRADRDDAARRRRLGDGGEPLARGAPRLHRG